MYASADQLKLALRAPTTGSWSDGTYDDQIERVLTAASTAIDEYCGLGDNGLAEPASYTRRAERTLVPDPTWTGDYITTPSVAVDGPSNVAPYLILGDGTRVYERDWDEGSDTLTGDWWWVHNGSHYDAWRNIRTRRRVRGPVKLVAVFGWPNGTPEAVVSACLIWAAHLFSLETAPLGAAVLGDSVVNMAHRPRGVDSLLAPYVQQGAVVA